MTTTLARNHWQDEGHLVIDGILDEEAWDGLLGEALASRDNAAERGISDVLVRRDGSFATPSRFRVFSGGEQFQALLRSRELLDALRSATQIARLVPVRCGYNYYTRGDFMGVHRDEVRATVTVTLALTDNLGFTAWEPGLRDASNKGLVDLVKERGHLPEVTQRLELPHRTLHAFDGYNIPHWRPPFEHDLGILGNMTYFEL